MRIWQYKVYLARHLGLPYEEVGPLPANNFLALIKEVDYQRKTEQYQLYHILGQIMCILANTKAQRYKPEQFVGEKPTAEVIKMVNKKKNDLVLSDGETYTLATLDVNMMEAIEDEFDSDWQTLFTAPRIKVLKCMLWHMLLPAYPDITRDKVGRLVTTSEIPLLVGIINGMTNG